MILALLLSPVNWVQHLVWLMPALYLILVDARSKAGLGTPTKIALAAYVLLAVVLNYELLGKQTFSLFLIYNPCYRAVVFFGGVGPSFFFVFFWFFFFLNFFLCPGSLGASNLGFLCGGGGLRRCWWG